MIHSLAPRAALSATVAFTLALLGCAPEEAPADETGSSRSQAIAPDVFGINVAGDAPGGAAVATLGARWARLELRDGTAGPDLSDEAVARIGANPSSNLVVTTAVVEGAPHEVILRVAEEWGADLIVLGSHGYGRAARAVLGSVAAAVFADAPCAVHIVRPGRPPVTAGSGDPPGQGPDSLCCNESGPFSWRRRRSPKASPGGSGRPRNP